MNLYRGDRLIVETDHTAYLTGARYDFDGIYLTLPLIVVFWRHRLDRAPSAHSFAKTFRPLYAARRLHAALDLVTYQFGVRRDVDGWWWWIGPLAIFWRHNPPCRTGDLFDDIYHNIITTRLGPPAEWI
jgi:hypothetical protein